MTLSESLRLLNLTAPITREELDLTCQRMLAATEARGAANLNEAPQASKLKIKTAHALLSRLSDGEFPFANPMQTPSGGRGMPDRERLPAAPATGMDAPRSPASLRAVAACTAVFLAVPLAGWLVLAVAGRPAERVLSAQNTPAAQQATPGHYSAAPGPASSASSSAESENKLER